MYIHMKIMIFPSKLLVYRRVYLGNPLKSMLPKSALHMPSRKAWRGKSCDHQVPTGLRYPTWNSVKTWSIGGGHGLEKSLGNWDQWEFLYQLIGFVGKKYRKIPDISWENRWFPVKIFPWNVNPLNWLFFLAHPAKAHSWSPAVLSASETGPGASEAKIMTKKWQCQEYPLVISYIYGTWPLIVDIPIRHGDFP